MDRVSGQWGLEHHSPTERFQLRACVVKPKVACAGQTPTMIVSRRAGLGLGIGLAATLWDTAQSQSPATAQSASAVAKTGRRRARRIAVSPPGGAAIERTRQRLQFAFNDQKLVFGAPVYLRLIKDRGKLEVWVQTAAGPFARLRSFNLCGRGAPLGPRKDHQTQPEGFYAIRADHLRPRAAKYIGLTFGWPNALDQTRGWARGSGPSPSVLQGGCAAGVSYGLTDSDIEELYTIVYYALASGQAGVPFHIFPFAMSPLRMLQVGNTENGAFWRDLAPVWQAFERTKTPPAVTIRGRRYRLSSN